MEELIAFAEQVQAGPQEGVLKRLTPISLNDN